MGLFKKTIVDYLGKAYDTSTISVEDTFKEMYSLEKVAIQMAISYVAYAISNSEFKVYQNNKLTKDDIYYHLNISPNINENATQFWNKIITKMYLNEKALVFDYRSDIYVADSFIADEDSIKGTTYNNIVLNNSDLSFDKKAKDIWLFRIDTIDIMAMLISVLQKYSNLFSESCNDLLNSNAERWIYEVENLSHGDDDFSQKWQETITKRLKPFVESRKGVIPLNREEKLSQVSNSSTSISSTDIINIRKDIFEMVASVFKMPQSMFTGNINNVEEVVNIFLTFCVDPIADMIGKEITRKLYGKDGYLKGNYIIVDTSCVNHYDLFSISEKADKLIASGISTIDEIRTTVNLEKQDTEWSSQHWFTKNYGKIEDILKGGDENA